MRYKLFFDDRFRFPRAKTRRGRRTIAWPQARLERERPCRKERQGNRREGGRA